MRNGDTVPAGLRHATVLPSLDFETYSEAGFVIADGVVKGAGPRGTGGLPLVGTPVYAEHPTAEILSAAYDLKDGAGVRLWVPGMPTPADLLDHVRSGGLLAAWNATFEFWIWNIVGRRRHNWPPLPLGQTRCDMAKARRFSLPGALGKAAAVLGTPGKDPEGGRLIQKLTRPHSATKHRPATRWTPATAWPDFAAMYRYNAQDVVAEDAAALRIPDLTPDELATWQLDQTINVRGVAVDMETLRAAVDVLGQVERKYTLRLATLTAGAVGSASEVERLRGWLSDQGVSLPDLQAETVRGALARDLPPQAREALLIRDELSAANVKKLRALLAQVSSDGRLRDQYMYCGADRTGRASAGGVQLQNITAKGPKTAFCEACGRYFGAAAETAQGCPRCGCAFAVRAEPEWTIGAVLQAVEDIRARDLSHIEHVWGSAIDVLCGCLRGLFVAAPGKKLICVDFSAIEAVVAACVSLCRWRIDVFSTHGKIYEASAANATGIPFDEILDYKKRTGSHHPARKGVGKIRELAGGYGGWIGAWKNFGADAYFDSDEAIKADVLKWRAESPEIVEMWGGQFRWCGPGKWDYRPELYGLEGCAIRAVMEPGRCFGHNGITYGVHDDVLYCRLPSGRFLHYHRPRLAGADDKLNRGPAVQLTFEGYNSNATRGPVGWVRMETYGGRLFENVVQAVAADIQFAALRRCEQAGYTIVMHTHDEGCAEVPDSPEYSVERMVEIMSERPEWASWWPIRAAGWEHQRYQKD